MSLRRRASIIHAQSKVIQNLALMAIAVRIAGAFLSNVLNGFVLYWFMVGIRGEKREYG